MKETTPAVGVLVILSLLLVAAACGDTDRCSTHDELERAITGLAEDPQQRTFDLRDLTEFEWNRLDAFGEYAPVEYVKARTGLDYREAWWQDVYVPESHTLLIFSNDEGPVCYFETKNAKAPGAAWSFGPSIFQEQGILIAGASFAVNRGSALPVLDLANQAP